MKTGYLAAEGMEEALKAELRGDLCQYGRLILAEGEPQSVHWAQNIWYDPQIISFQSISEGAKKLRSLQSLWVHYPYSHIRRAELIGSQLPFFSPKPLSFPSTKTPVGPLGSWTLLDDRTLLAAPRCSSPFAHGEIHFQETKFPPSRAYLKLWEIFTRLGRMPKTKERCLEIGASPGSWTWVLQTLQAEVIAVDRAPLDPSIAKLSGVSFLKKDAFSLKPSDFEFLDWVFSDVICYPEKLLEWLQPWLELDVNLICTLKFQGAGERAILQEFEKIPRSGLVHLFHNKHELTWFRLKNDE